MLSPVAFATLQQSACASSLQSGVVMTSACLTTDLQGAMYEQLQRLGSRVEIGHEDADADAISV